MLPFPSLSFCSTKAKALMCLSVSSIGSGMVECGLGQGHWHTEGGEKAGGGGFYLDELSLMVSLFLGHPLGSRELSADIKPHRPISPARRWVSGQANFTDPIVMGRESFETSVLQSEREKAPADPSFEDKRGSHVTNEVLGIIFTFFSQPLLS